MSSVTGLETSFNTVFTKYGKLPPTYIPGVYDDIFSTKEINQLSALSEMGIGSWQARRPILEKDDSLTTIELGK
jgi:hypothetical protein